MEELNSFYFPSVYHALSYYQYSKPGKIKSTSDFDRHRGLTPENPAFFNLEPESIYAAITLCLKRVYKTEEEIYSKAFAEYYLGQSKISVKDLAKTINLSSKSLSKALDRMLCELERQLIKFDLMEYQKDTMPSNTTDLN